MKTAALALMLAVGAVLAVAAPNLSFADNDAGPTASAPEAVQPATGPADIPLDRDDLVAQVKDLKAKVDAVRSARPGERAVAIAALIAGVVFILISGLKRITGMTKRGKRWIPWVLMSLSVVGAIAAHYAGGASLLSSIIVAGGGPGAVLVNELWKSLKPG